MFGESQIQGSILKNGLGKRKENLPILLLLFARVDPSFHYNEEKP
jgi:hypothetical protein